MYIDSEEKLKELCDGLKKAKFICVDTEFLREKTFYPELCLIQINHEGSCYAIDPFGLDINPLLKILTGRKLIVLHAGKQDLEIIYNLSGKLPKNIFDTQIAAMVCGFGEQASYQQLVEKICGLRLNKKMQFTNWAHRPLSPEQVEYALDDVKHLPLIYAELSKELKDKKRKKWLIEEEKDLVDLDNYKENPTEAWRKIKHKSKKYCNQAVLQAVAAWRDTKAREVNKPRRFVLKDEAVIEIALHPPKAIEDFKKVRSVGRHDEKMFKEILDVVTPSISKKIKTKTQKHIKHEPPLDQGVIDLLKILLKAKCLEAGVAPRLVAVQDDLEDFSRGYKTSFDKGWRKFVFGEAARDLMEGKISFSVKDGNIKVS